MLHSFSDCSSKDNSVYLAGATPLDCTRGESFVRWGFSTELSKRFSGSGFRGVWTFREMHSSRQQGDPDTQRDAHVIGWFVSTGSPRYIYIYICIYTYIYSIFTYIHTFVHTQMCSCAVHDLGE